MEASGYDLHQMMVPEVQRYRTRRDDIILYIGRSSLVLHPPLQTSGFIPIVGTAAISG